MVRKSKKLESTAITPATPTPPEVILPPTTSLPSLGNGFARALNSVFNGLGLSGSVNGQSLHYEELPLQDRKTIDAFVEQLEPEIEAKSKDLMRAEIRDRVVKMGNISEIERLLRRGKKPHLMRKRGCIYIQFGTGAPYDEIEEFMVASS